MEFGSLTVWHALRLNFSLSMHRACVVLVATLVVFAIPAAFGSHRAEAAARTQKKKKSKPLPRKPVVETKRKHLEPKPVAAAKRKQLVPKPVAEIRHKPLDSPRETARVETARAEAAASTASAPPPTRGPTRIDFDDRLIQGQTNKSGAVYLYDRKELKTRSMIKQRESFRDEIVGSVYDS